MGKLADRVALVTGGQRGLGAAVVHEFRREGARCVINYPTTEEESDAAILVDAVQSSQNQAVAVRADVGNANEVDVLVRQVLQTYGRLDILVNNAGVNPLLTWEDLDRQHWDRTINVNLTGVFNCCKAVLPIMKEQRKGNIINIASIAAYIGRGNADYIASKSAIIGLTRSLARQFGPHGIRANAIAPGFHETDMVRRARGNVRENADEFIKQVPLGFLPKPDSIGRAALYLASDDSYYVTGHTLVVDGGLTLR